MGNRIGIVGIVVRDGAAVKAINDILSEFGHCIRGRLGLPCLEDDLNLISVVVEATTDDFGALTGRLGRLEGVRTKSLMMT